MMTIMMKDCAARPPLPTITTGKSSTLEFEVVGAPDGLQELTFHVSGANSPRTFSSVVASALPGGRWRVYANGLYFPDAGRAEWQLTGKDGKDNAVWLGKGRLEVVDCVLSSSGKASQIVPDDCYIRNPDTGLWHKVTATVEDGEIVLQYDKEGVER